MFKQTTFPRWRGFNLLGVFVMSSPGYFEEEDFKLISELGFDFVRLPLNYTFWIDYNDPFEINEEKLSVVDQAVRWGEKYGLHVNLAFHRAPGFSVAGDRVEPFDLWSDDEAQEAFNLHWSTFAKRYKGISNEKMSFNLLNEPADIDPASHEDVMRAAIDEIRAQDTDRLVILDGLNYGTVPMADLGDMAKNNVGQSCRAYIPHGITHYRALWVDNRRTLPTPQWLGGYTHTGPWDRERLELHYGAWAALAQNFGMGVHCGEGGCYSKTPHDVTLRWMEDVLDVLKSYNIGYALWNFKGPFGILNSEREDVAYEDWKGHKLDRKMYELLKKY